VLQEQVRPEVHRQAFAPQALLDPEEPVEERPSAPGYQGVASVVDPNLA